MAIPTYRFSSVQTSSLCPIKKNPKMNCNYIPTFTANTYTQLSIGRRLSRCTEATYSELLCFIATSKCFSRFCNYCITLYFSTTLYFFSSQHPSPAPSLFGRPTTYVAARGLFLFEALTILHTRATVLEEKPG